MIITDDLGGVWRESRRILEKLGKSGRSWENLGESQRILEKLGGGGRLQIVFGGRLQNAPT